MIKNKRIKAHYLEIRLKLYAAIIIIIQLMLIIFSLFENFSTFTGIVK